MYNNPNESSFNPAQPQLDIGVLSNSVDVTCSECKNETYTMVFLIKKLPALVSPTGEDMMIPVQSFACTSCGNINPEFMKNLDTKK